MKVESIWFGTIVGLLACCAMFGIIYLFGSFAMATTDIEKWSHGFRGFVGTMGGIVSAAVGFACGAATANNMEEK